jgi:phosphate transport system substrate-binding protein
LSTAKIKNKDGNFVAPTLENTTAALAGVEPKADLTYNPLNAAGANAYPIVAPTYVLVYVNPQSKAAAIKGWLNYLLNEGQAIAKDASFAPLPESLRTKAIAQIAQIQG